MTFALSEVKCTECPLWETSVAGDIQRSGVYGDGSGRSGIWLYGESLGRDEVLQGIPFMGPVGDILNKILREINLKREDLFITNAVRCRPTSNKVKKNVKPKAAHIKTCMDTHAVIDVAKTPPKLIVCLGEVALKALLNRQKIKKNRGIIFECEKFNCAAMVTYHPASILRNKKTNIYHIIKHDLIKAREYIMGTSEPIQKTHRVLINTRETFLDWMDILSDKGLTDRVCDIETTGLDFWKDKPVSMSFTTEIDNEIYTIAFLTDYRFGWWFADFKDLEIRNALQKVLKFPIDFHGGIFDVKFFWQNGFSINQGADTMDMHSMLEEDSPHNLAYCVSIYNKEDKGYKQAIAAELGEEGSHCELPPERLLDYNCDDTYHTFLLKKKFIPLMKKENVWNFYNSIPKLLEKSLTRMSYRGIMMDVERVVAKSKEYREKILQGREELFDKVGEKFKYSGSGNQLPNILYNKLGLPILKRTENDNPSTDKYVLEELALTHDIPGLILKLRTYEGALRMYLDGNDLKYEIENGELIYKPIDPENGMLNKLDSNGRIHGPFLACGTYTGRPSCPKPNLLNIPRNPEIRGLFIAPPGWKLIEVDYSQAELVVLAFLSQDQQFMKDVMSEDFHLSTAKTITHSDDVPKAIRDASKSVNFLKSYGGGAEKLGKTLDMMEQKRFLNEFNLTKKYLLRCTNQLAWHHARKDNAVPVKYNSVNKTRKICYVCEADEWLKKWDKSYSNVPIFKESQKQLWKSQGYIEGLYGRKKRFREFFNKAQESYQDRVSVNYMCQNGVSETINRAIIDIDYELDLIFNWSFANVYSIPGLVLTVYDSIIAEAPDEYVPDIAELMKTMMCLPIPKLNIALKYDIKIGQRWGESLDEFEIENLEDIQDVA